MPPLDVSRTFCIIEARNEEARLALDCPHNAKFRVTEQLPKGLQHHPSHVDRVRLALTLDLDIFNHPQSGILFGNDEKQCDVQLYGSEEQGVSRYHFRLSWHWSAALLPTFLHICNLSPHGTRVSSTYLKSEGRLALNQAGGTSVDVGQCILSFEIPRRNSQQQRIFEFLWGQFILDAPHVKPRIDVFGNSLVEVATRPTSHMFHDRALDLHLEEIKVIGKGAFGEVWLCAASDGSTICAKKKINLKTFKSNPCYQREVQIMKSIRHQSLVRCLHFTEIETDDCAEIYMEYADYGTLHDYRIQARNDRLAEPVVKEIARQVLQGLAYLHKSAILHRDIKPTNILVYNKDPLDVRIADFGLSRVMEIEAKSLTLQVGTFGYMAPEVLLRSDTRYWMPGFASQRYTDRSDVFSLGVTLWELLVGSRPWSRGQSAEETHRHLMKPLKTAPLLNKVSINGLLLIASMLNREPLDRPKSSDCLYHDWFSELPIAPGRQDIPSSQAPLVFGEQARTATFHNTISGTPQEASNAATSNPVGDTKSHLTVATVLLEPSREEPSPVRKRARLGTANFGQEEADVWRNRSFPTTIGARSRSADVMVGTSDPLPVPDGEYFGSVR